MPDEFSVYEGRKCHIIKVLLSRSHVTRDVIREELMLRQVDITETVGRMESEGVVFMMPIAGRRVIFLTDRGHWSGKLEEHRAERSDRRARLEAGIPEKRNRRMVDRARFELATSTMPM